MKVLILSFYYPPDLSAGSFRALALVKALREVGNENLQIDVITSMPNRYRTLTREAATEENQQGVRVRRIALPGHDSGMADQAYAFIHFARQARRLVRGQDWDIVFATSSRLMTAALGAHLAKHARAPLYLDIRDLFTDTMSDLLAHSPLRFALPLFRLLERRTFRSASHINLVSAGFESHVRAIAPDVDLSIFTNGIDDEFLANTFSTAGTTAERPPLILYAGNIGEGQGLHSIVPAAAAALAQRARFRVIGDGGRRKQLEAAMATSTGRGSVELRDPVPRVELLEQYREADILFLHLNDHAAFRKVLPSKLFEYAATGKPILAGVAGHAAEFLRSEVPAAEVFDPCDVAGMCEAFDRLLARSGTIDRESFKQRFARHNIMRRMANDILDQASAGITRR
ncbi:glycosyltransferase family 4 protein [Sphingomonas sp. Root241]|uniref:glycosyltransferase family 4 protein n=1 Tax=Sphingomonas sp. Root241 TaxID=1736501 RepID=UPI0006FE3E62|nr:glycosyltransferase family 4 protein [Sphingomonas sp. Root241]KRC81708.1 glycosyl transferase family 1 [Sphingomonas sp. Root241]